MIGLLIAYISIVASTFENAFSFFGKGVSDVSSVLT